MKIVAILQARMSSTRLPGKVLAEVVGKPLLEHVVRRARQAQMLNQVVVATTTEPSDDALVRFCVENNIPCFRGQVNDVLDRYYQAALRFDADVIVRLTADCPLLDPLVIDKVVGLFSEEKCDYASNVHPPTFPDGLDTEVFGMNVLRQAWQEARLTSEREHVTAYIWKRPKVFRLVNLRNEVDTSSLRWTVDELCDLEFVQAVYLHLYRAGQAPFRMADILALLEREPALKEINAGLERNEGYAKSIRED
jgi:spore coat polysaccharide biosynthesis protein SpsF